MRQRTTLFLGLAKTITLAAWVLSASRTWATDWPTWRFDAARSATTTEQLPDELHLQWSWQLPQLQPAWPEDERLEFDAHYEPVVAGGIVFVASPLNHSVSAYDLQSGDRRWRFFADGPVRFAPVCANGRVYVGADDGCLYCLAAESGNVLWKFKGAPSNRMVIGNERLISVWPVRGAPFLQDGKLYFTIGVWPFEGTLLYEVDAETGRELRVIDLDDHSPQGYLATNGQTIVIPGGRSRAFLVDIMSGTRQPCSYDSKGLTDYHVAAHSQYFFHGDRVFPFGTESPVALELTADRPVVDGNRVVFVAQGELKSYDIDDMKLEERTDRRGEKYNVRVPRQVWKLEGEPVEQVHLKAGGYVYAHHANQMIVVESAASAEASPRLVSKTKIDGTPASMIAADQHLVVVTKEGRLLCMGKDRRIPRTYVETQSIRPAPRDEQVAKLVRAAGTDAGYCLVVGAGNPTLLHGLADQTEFHTIVIDNDRAAIGKLREEFSATGQYGPQIVAIEGDLQSLRLPPYFASLVVCEDRQLAGDNYGSAVYSPLRPYGGVAAMVDQRVDDVQRAFGRQANADVREDAGLVTVHRAGALPGSANWTHEYGDPANSLMSQDDLVMSPLGLLWYGGPSSDGSLFFDRHDWPPSATIIDGRMFIQGPDTFAAIDVYTGRVLWKIPLPAGTSPGRRSNWGSHGYHFVAESDGIYLTFPERCYWLSPETGNIIREFTVDDPDQWGRIRVVGDTIVAPLFREVGSPAEFVPAKLVALNRHTGEKLWQVDSEAGFPLVAIGNNKVFVYEGKLDGLYVGDSRERRRGLPVRKSPTLMRAFDLATGLPLWQQTTEYAESWLAYSAKHDVLLMSNKDGIDALSGENGSTLWAKRSDGEGFKGHPENYWDKIIVWDDWIIDQRGPGKSYDVKTGEAVSRINPISGKEVDWQFTKIGHHCNYAIANPHLMTFRAASAGFCDIETGETSRLNGFRPGCRNSLIPANGILNAPNFGYGCTCSYSLFTSLAMVHLPDDANFWTYSQFTDPIDEVQRVGINLGAPGDRRDDDGTMWLDVPNVGGPSPEVQVVTEFHGDHGKFYRLHPSQVIGDGLKWVSASGVEGVKRVSVTVGQPQSSERPYAVTLWFLEPTVAEVGQRVMNLKVQGKQIAENLDVFGRSGGKRHAYHLTVDDVMATDQIVVDVEAVTGDTVLSGLEIRKLP